MLKPRAHRRIRLLLLATSAALALPTAWPAAALDLQAAVANAVNSNPEIGAVQADRRATEQELRQARSLWLPSVDLGGELGPEYTDKNIGRVGRDGDDGDTLLRAQGSLTLTQLLFDGFARSSEVDRQLARVDSAARRVTEAAEFVGLSAVEAYLDVLRHQEILGIAQANLSEHERILGGVRSLTDQGRTGIADVRQAEVRVASARDALAVAEGNLLDARATFERVVGLPAASLSDAVAPAAFLPVSAEAAAALARDTSPTVQIADADIDVARAELAASRSGYYPKFSVETGATGGHDINGVDGQNVVASALLVMRYNLFRGGADVAREREAYHRLNEALLQRERAERAAAEQATLSFNALRTARARTEALGAAFDASRGTRDAYAEEFQLGQRSLLSLLDAQNELFLSRADLVSARRTQEFAVYRVLASVGGMLEALEISRPPESVNIWRKPVDDPLDPEPPPERTVNIPPLEGPPERTPPIPPEFRGSAAPVAGEPTPASASFATEAPAARPALTPTGLPAPRLPRD